MDYSTLSSDALALIDQVHISEMDDEGYNAYYARSMQLGRIYQINGKCLSGDKLVDYFGTGAKRLHMTNSGWEIIISPCGQEFLRYPKLVDEKEFYEAMKSLGVKDSLIKEFIHLKIDWDNF